MPMDLFAKSQLKKTMDECVLFMATSRYICSKLHPRYLTGAEAFLQEKCLSGNEPQKPQKLFKILRNSSASNA